MVRGKERRCGDVEFPSQALFNCRITVKSGKTALRSWFCSARYVGVRGDSSCHHERRMGGRLTKLRPQYVLCVLSKLWNERTYMAIVSTKPYPLLLGMWAGGHPQRSVSLLFIFLFPPSWNVFFLFLSTFF